MIISNNFVDKLDLKSSKSSKNYFDNLAIEHGFESYKEYLKYEKHLRNYLLAVVLPAGSTFKDADHYISTLQSDRAVFELVLSTKEWINSQ